MKYLFLIMFLVIQISNIVIGDELLKKGNWLVCANKGELKKVSFNDSILISKLGDFNIIKKGIRPFIEVTELREKTPDQLVYEGITDDGKHLFAEFGQVVTVGKNVEFLLFMSYLPPSSWPTDVTKGILKFGSDVTDVKKVAIDPQQVVIPGTIELAVTLKNGGKFRIQVVGLAPEKTVINKSGGYTLKFQEAENYVFSPVGKRQRTLAYWISSTDTHYIKFIISKDN